MLIYLINKWNAKRTASQCFVLRMWISTVSYETRLVDQMKVNCNCYKQMNMWTIIQAARLRCDFNWCYKVDTIFQANIPMNHVNNFKGFNHLKLGETTRLGKRHPGKNTSDTDKEQEHCWKPVRNKRSDVKNYFLEFSNQTKTMLVMRFHTKSWLVWQYYRLQYLSDISSRRLNLIKFKSAFFIRATMIVHMITWFYSIRL